MNIQASNDIKTIRVPYKIPKSNADKEKIPKFSLQRGCPS